MPLYSCLVAERLSACDLSFSAELVIHSGMGRRSERVHSALRGQECRVGSPKSK